MQEKFTTSKNTILLSRSFILFITAFLFSFTSSAQTCLNETMLWTENFGSNVISASNPDVINLNYWPSGELVDGSYRVASNTQQRSEWHLSLDHTPFDSDGGMLVINGGSPNTYFSHTITSTAGFFPGFYSGNIFVMNVNTPGTCSPNPIILPTLTFTIDYNTEISGNDAGWVQLQYKTSPSYPTTTQPTWNKLGSIFELPVIAKRIRIRIDSNLPSGCGNDFAIDDIQFSTCPSGAPLPVEFLNITAIQKGAGVNVNWSTATEVNNKYFVVEKSLDGSSWSAINSINGIGNSNTSKSYSSFDAKPVAGYNYYRIRQVDIDGKVKYSSVVKVKINIDKTSVSVLANPFVNNIIVDFLSNSNQMVFVRLTDISGKLIGTEKWKISQGSTRMTYDNVAGIQRGMYLLTVMDDNGNVIYNNKLMKQ